jgi:hypothetical protein
VRLGDSDWWIEVRIVGYESEVVVETGEQYDFDTDWLVVYAEVKGPAGDCSYGGISLDVEDARRLVDWLHAVAASEVGPHDAGNKVAVFFKEPEFGARLMTRVGDRVTIRWYFWDPTSTEDLSSDVIFQVGFPFDQASSVDVTASSRRVDGAARELSDALHALVERRKIEVIRALT